MATPARQTRVAAVAAALLFLLGEGGDAFVLPSSPLANPLPTFLIQQQQRQDTLLRSIQFMKGETKYGDIVDGSVNSGMLNSLGGGSSSIGGFGGTRKSVGTNSLSRARRARRGPSWWSSRSSFSRSTATSLLASGSLESWPVMEADDIQILVKKGEDLDDDDDDDDDYNKWQEDVYDEYGNLISPPPTIKKKKTSVKATLERWERDIALPVVGYDNNGYPMLGNELQPNGYGNGDDNDRCTQSIQFDVANGDIYPFSGTISVPPPLTVEDSMGNQQTVMMVLNNPDDDDGESYDDYGNPMMLPGSSSFGSMQKKKKKGQVLEAKVEPLYKTPDEKYAEAQQNQQQQYPEYDEWGNEIYNQDQSYDQSKTTIPSQGYQAFPINAMDPSSGKIKISLERDSNGGGAFGMGRGGNNGEMSQARVEIYHGFRDQYGNSHSYNADEEDRRISLDVSTMHPSFSSVIDTMPADLLAKHSALDTREYQPYLEVRIVNTGGAALKAGVQSYLPYYKPQNKQEKQRRQYQRQQFETQQTLQRNGRRSIGGMSSMMGSTVKADDPFLLVDSAQSTTSARRIKTDIGSTSNRQKSYVRYDRASNSMSNDAQSFSQSSNFMDQGFGNTNNFNNNNYGNEFDNSFSRRSTRSRGGIGGVQPNVPGGNSGFGATSESRSKSSSGSSQQSYYQGSMMNGDSNSMLNPRRNRVSTDMGRTAMSVDGMGTSFSDRVPASPLSPDYYEKRWAQQQRQASQRGPQSYGGPTIDTVATTPGGRSSGLLTPDNDFSNPNASKRKERSNSNMMVPRTSSLVRRSIDGPGISSFGGNGGMISGMENNGFHPQTLQDDVFGRQSSQGQFLTGPGSLQGQTGMGSSSLGQFNNQQRGGPGQFQRQPREQQQRRTSSSFSGNGNVIGDGVISGRPASAGVSPFSSGMPNNSNRFGEDEYGSSSGFNNNMSNGEFGGNNNNSGPFGNIGRAPQTKGNSKNPFAQLNGESNPNEYSNGGNTSFGGSNNRMNSANNGIGNSFAGSPSGGIGGSPSQRQSNPFSNLNGKKPFGNIGTPGGSTTAMRSSYDDYSSSDSKEANPIVGFAKNFVKGMTGGR